MEIKTAAGEVKEMGKRAARQLEEALRAVHVVGEPPEKTLDGVEVHRRWALIGKDLDSILAVGVG